MNEFRELAYPGRARCAEIFKVPEDSHRGWAGATMCPEDGGQACGIHPLELGGGRRRRAVTCNDFCVQHGHVCQSAVLTSRGQCDPVRSWDCAAVPPSSSNRRRSQHLKCTCFDSTKVLDKKIF